MGHEHNHHHHDETEAERIARAERERQQENLDELKETSKQSHGVEKGADFAPHENRTPMEEHRGGPLPNQKR